MNTLAFSHRSLSRTRSSLPKPDVIAKYFTNPLTVDDDFNHKAKPFFCQRSCFTSRLWSFSLACLPVVHSSCVAVTHGVTWFS